MQINKSIILLVLGRVLQAGLAIATMKLATYYLSFKEMGNYYVLSSIATFFGITLISPIGQFVNRKFHSWVDQGIILKRLFLYNFYIIGISILSIPIIIIAKKFFGFITDISYLEVLFLSVTSIYLNTWFGTLVPALNMLNRRISFTLFTILNLAGSLLLSVFFIFLYQMRGTFWYFGQYVAFQLIITIIALIYFKKIISEKINVVFLKPQITLFQIKNIANFSVPLMIATFFMWLLNDSYRFIVEKLLGLEVLGNLAVGLSISASIFALLESLFQQIYFPKFYRQITNATQAKRLVACQDLIDVAFPAFIFTTMFLICSSPFILRLLTSEKFSSSLVFVVFGFGISLFRILTNVIANIAHSEFNTKKLIPPYALGGILTVVLMVVFLKFFHNNYVVGFVLIGCNFLVLVFMKHHMFKIIKSFIPWSSILKISLLALPFIIEILFWNRNDIISSFTMLCVFGSYYLFVLFKKYFKTIPQS